MKRWATIAGEWLRGFAMEWRMLHRMIGIMRLEKRARVNITTVELARWTEEMVYGDCIVPWEKFIKPTR